jgi:hypothetical protein
MSSTFFGASFDASNAAHAAAFWAAALNRPVAAGADERNAVVEAGDPSGGPRLSFHQVPEPKSVKNRFHPDLITGDYEAEAQRLVALGAIKLNEVVRDNARWTTFADVEGNEFDLIAG